MSDSISTSLPGSGSSSLEAYDNAGSIEGAWSSGLKPDPALLVSQWADRNRWLTPRSAAEPGLYRTARTPYLRDVMDCLSPSNAAQRVIFMKGAQVGATEAGTNWVGFIIHQAPGPVLAVQPTVDLAKRYSQQRVDTLIEASPAVRGLVQPARARDSGNTVLSKEFPGGQLVMTGANSAVGLRSMPARYLFLDEVDAYPPSADDEGDPVALAEARTRTFAYRRKVFLVSTPTIKGLSRIERAYEASDQRRFFVPCPLCGKFQWLKFERLRWQKGQPEAVRYACEHCDGDIAEHHKTAILDAGEWRATAKSADPRTVGFHISSLYSPVGWLSWEQIARDWEAAQGNDDAIKAFKNTVLGETWFETGEAPDWQRLYERRDAYAVGTAPDGVLFLTAAGDLQHDRIEIDVWGWGRGLRSWLVDHIVVYGDPASATFWSDVEEVAGREWPHDSGVRMRIQRLAVDSGDGRFTSVVYAWVRRQDPRVVMAVKGVGSFDRASPVSGPTYVEVTEGGRKIKRGARLWTVAVSMFKAETYRWLRLARPTDEQLETGAGFPDGYVHLPQGLPDEWFKQLCAEQLVTVRNRRGFSKLEWQKLRERNEALDARVYARAAAWVVGVDRFTDARWRELEVQLDEAVAATRRQADALMPPSREDAEPEAGRLQVRRPEVAGRRPASWLGGRNQGWLR